MHDSALLQLWRVTLLENSPASLHSSGATFLMVRRWGAFLLNSFNVINALRKSAVKYVAIFYCCNLGAVLWGFLFVFPEANLYNAARLAGRVSFEVIY